MLDNHREIKQIWLKEMLELVKESDPGLGLGDKIRIRNAVYQFVDDYIEAQGNLPHPHFGDIYKFYNYINSYGYIMPEVDKWIEEDMRFTRKVAQKKGIKLTLKRPVFQGV